MHVQHLIIGAGMTGLAYANFIDSDDYLILEKESSIGGWCKTVKKDGFVWDYSGHFFHFRDPDIEAYLRERMPGEEISTVVKNSKILTNGHWIDFPFQKNIHQLPKSDFIDCLHGLVFRDDWTHEVPDSFGAMLYEKFGPGIAERFLIPYNEKLYACDLELLDRDAMGRFFPHANLKDVVANMVDADNSSYNSTFTYPANGAIKYVEALKSEVSDSNIALEEELLSLDLSTRTATTSRGREISFEFLVSSAPLDRFLKLTDLEVDTTCLSSNKVLVFNLGFDSKGPEGIHWIYFPDRDVPFYRVGFYDNILSAPRMSLYVELGFASEAEIDVETQRQRVLNSLRDVGLVDEQELVAWHTVTLDPAYVHINTESRQLHAEVSELLAARGVFSIGRYGGWTYCSIEDNILEARALARRINRVM